MTAVDQLVEGRSYEVLLSGGSFYESPRWRSGAWYVSDLYRGTVWCMDDAGDTTTVTARIDDFAGGLGWRQDGAILVVSMTKRQIVAVDPWGTQTVHSDLSDRSSSRLNDMITDSKGRAWVGNYGFDLMSGEAPRTGSLFYVAPDGSASIAATGLMFPNGAVLARRESVLIVGETFAGRYTQFDVAPGGTLVHRRAWAEFGDVPKVTTVAEMREELRVIPDGCALDSEGCLWVSDVKGRRAIRVAEGGRVLDEVQLTAGHCYACGLGGPDGRSLVLCIAPGSAQKARRSASDAVMVRVRVPVPAAAS